MKALILSRPGDFGSLEDHWPHHPLALPVLGVPIYRHHAAFLASLGVLEVRVLRAGGGVLDERDLALERQLQKDGGREWSMRAWTQGPYPQGKTLPEILAQQRLFQDGDDVLVVSAPMLPLEPLTGPRVPPAVPVSSSRLLLPRLLSAQGVLAQSDLGTWASLVGPFDYYRTVSRLLAAVKPGATLKGVHHRATLEAPLWLGEGVKVAAGARVGPDTLLAARSRIEKGASVVRTLVLSAVAIGRDAAFVGKLLLGNVVINPDDGSWVRVEDEKVLKALK